MHKKENEQNPNLIYLDINTDSSSPSIIQTHLGIGKP